MANVTFPMAVVIRAIDRVTAPLRNMQSGLSRFGQSASRIGGTLTKTVSLPVAGFLANSVRLGVAYEKSMQRVAAATGKPRAELEAVAKLVRELGATPPFSATEMAHAAEMLGREGKSVAEILQLLPLVADLAAGQGIELAQAVEIITDSMDAFGLPASRAVEIVDKFTRAADLGGKGSGSFVAAIDTITPTAKAMNLSLDDTATVLAALHRNGLEGAKAGAALQNALNTLSLAGSNVSQVMDRLGIPKSQILDSEGRVRSITGTLRALAAAGATTGDVLELFGKKAGPGLAGLVADGGAALNQLERDISASTGASMQRAKIATDGVGYSFERLGGSFEELSIAIAESGMLEGVGKIVDALTGWITEMSKTNPELLKTGSNVAVVAAALGPLITGLVKAASVLAQIWSWLAKIGSLASEVGSYFASSPLGKVLGLTGAYNLFQFGDWIKKYGDSSYLDRFATEHPNFAKLVPEVPPVPESAYRQATREVTAEAPWWQRFMGTVPKEAIDRRAQEIRTQAAVTVDFKNVPPGVEIERKGAGDAALDLRVGYAMGY